jgi:benzoate-CoA ligase family protein
MTSEKIDLFNACEYLLDRRIAAGDGARTAVIGTDGELTYAQLLDRVQRTAAVLHRLGLEPEQRLMMFMADSPEFAVVFLAALRIGAVPVPVSTMTNADDLAELLRDSRARVVACTPQYSALVSAAVVDAPELHTVLMAGRGPRGGTISGGVPLHDLDTLLTELAHDTGPDLGSGTHRGPDPGVYPTTGDSTAFWLYTSGTTGTAKGAMHRHESIRVVCETYGAQVLGIGPDDRCLSAAKAFFAYGLGNSLLFPLSVGAAAVLEPAPSKADLLADRIRRDGVTLFFAGPTFFANMLHADLAPDALAGVRLAVSAGEALPAALYSRWTSRFGVDILDGIGMTEMLHIFLSNREGAVRPGTTGVAVPGYELRILDDDGAPVPRGTPGTLFVRGDSAATGYWSRYDATRRAFQGEWLRTGDTYIRDADGYYTCLGRTGDMLKASGIWVAPAEVEDRLLAHPAVGQAVVVAALDGDGLEKPVAYVVLRTGQSVAEDELIEFCCGGLSSFKRPRRIVFVDGYPTTATGKVRRVELRRMAAGVLLDADVSGR